MTIPDLARKAKELEEQAWQELKKKRDEARELVQASKLLPQPKKTIWHPFVAILRAPIFYLGFTIADAWGSYKCPECGQRLKIEAIDRGGFSCPGVFRILTCSQCHYKYAFDDYYLSMA